MEAPILDIALGVAQGAGTHVYASILWTSSGGAIVLPEGENFLRADFGRAGPDLLIETPAGGHFVIADYFAAVAPPPLETVDGAVLSASMVMHLAGPAAPGMVAQAAGVNLTNLGEPIGQANEAEGVVTVTHANGMKASLSVGDNIFQGDVLETAGQSSTSIVFIDDTIFSLDGDGRMIMDEMVYDAGTQTGIFNAQVIQGVFSFVSGKVAKTSPDGMVVSTPTITMGIRGSTVLGRAAAEGAENKFTLVNDVDGGVGEIVVSNAAGSMVLNQAGASTSVFSAFSTPAPMFILSPQQIQQDFGATLTRVVKTVAKQAEQKLQHAQQQAQDARQESEQVQQDAQQAQDEAVQATETAAQADADVTAAQADAVALAAEAEAAKVEAEASGDAVSAAKATALEVKAAEAAVQVAQAETQAEAAKAQAQVAQAEAAAADARVADAEQQSAKATAQAEQDLQFSTMAGSAAVAQEHVYTQFIETGFVDPAFAPGAPPPDGGLNPNAPPDGQSSVSGTAGTASTVNGGGANAADAAVAQAAYEAAMAAGATPDEAFTAAALAASGGDLNDPAVVAAKAAFDAAIAAGASPQDAMHAAQAAAAGQGGPGPDPNAPQQPNGPLGGSGPFSGGPGSQGGPGGPSPFGGPGPLGGSPLDPALALGPLGPNNIGPGMGPGMGPGIYNPLAFDPTYGSNAVTYDPFVSQPLVTFFNETLVAKDGGGTLSGSSLDTNFYFSYGNTRGAYTLGGNGGTDQISLDNLENVKLKVVANASTGVDGFIQIWSGFGATETAGGERATLDYSNVQQFLLADGLVSGLSAANYQTAQTTDVLVLGGLQAGDTGYVIAGTEAADTLVLNQAFSGAIVFGKGGGDTFNIQTASDLIAIGGFTASDNLDDGTNGGTAGDLIPDAGLNIFDYSGWGAGVTAISAILSGAAGEIGGDASVSSTSQNGTLNHDLWDVSSLIGTSLQDSITINSGHYNTIDGSGGNDSIIVKATAMGQIGSINGGAGTDGFAIKTDVGGTFDMNSYSYTNVLAFEAFAFFGANATGALTVTAKASGATLKGSAHNDTLIGSAAADTLQGNGGVDTLTGNGGADIFKYASAGDTGVGVGAYDTITDFATGVDTINIASIVGGGGFAYQALSSNSAASVQAFLSGSILQFDTTNDGLSNMEIDVGGATVTFTDFVTV